MANEINLAYLPGKTLYAVVKTASGLYVKSGTPGPFLVTDWPSYAIPVPELVAASGQYQGAFPVVPGGAYHVEIYLQAAGTPALADGPPVAEGHMDWSGAAETYSVAERVATADVMLTRDWTLITAIVSPRCLLNAMRFLRNHWKVVSGAVNVYKEDDSTLAWTKPIVTTPGAEPITEMGP